MTLVNVRFEAKAIYKRAKSHQTNLLFDIKVVTVDCAEEKKKLIMLQMKLFFWATADFIFIIDSWVSEWRSG